MFPEAKDRQVILLKDFDEEIAVLDQDFLEDPSNLVDFLALHMFPTIMKLSDRALEKVLSESSRKGVFFFRSESDPDASKYDNELKKVATTFRSKDYIFFHTDIKGNLEKQIADTFGVEEASLPILQSVELKQETMMYRHNGAITEKDMKEFLEKWQKGSVTRYYTSEPIPQENPGPVYKVVGKSFKQEVIDNTQHVFLMSYSPWCEFSALLEPIYKKVALLFQREGIKFCKIDATKNDLEEHPLEGYPLIKFYPAKYKDAAFIYEGDFTEEALTVFIEESTGMRIDLPIDTPAKESESIKTDL